MFIDFSIFIHKNRYHGKSVPEQNLVVVFTSALPEQQFFRPEQIFRSFILSPLSGESLPEDPDAFKNLKETLTDFSRGPDAVPVSFPPLAESVSGKLIEFDDNPLRLNALTLFFDETGSSVKEYYEEETQLFAFGTDGRFRFTSVGDSRIAVKGRWITENSLRFELRDVGNTRWMNLSLMFNGNEVTLNASGNWSGNYRFKGKIKAD